jgi:Predicted metal-binding integral membrane protein (DUF2182)
MLDAVLRHDRTLVVVALAVVIMLSWVWLLTGAGLHMDEMDMGGGQIMLMAPPWTVGYAAMIFLMSIIMMAAMMLPSAAPAILLVAALTRQRGERHAICSSAQFALGYVAVWGAFSLIATGLQWGLDRAGLLSETMASGSIILAALLLFAAGLYQLTTWKQACLQHCRSPLAFLMRYWRRGPLGPMRAGGVARGVLPRMLLDADGAPVRGRPHESALDRRTGASGADREAVPARSPREPTHRRRLDWLGRVRSRPLTVLAVKLAEISGESACCSHRARQAPRSSQKHKGEPRGESGWVR